MVTSNVTRAGHSSRVTISISTAEGQQSGLLTDSVIMTDNIATILSNEIDRVIGSLSVMEAVNAALRFTFGL